MYFFILFFMFIGFLIGMVVRSTDKPPLSEQETQAANEYIGKELNRLLSKLQDFNSDEKVRLPSRLKRIYSKWIKSSDIKDLGEM